MKAEAPRIRRWRPAPVRGAPAAIAALRFAQALRRRRLAQVPWLPAAMRLLTIRALGTRPVAAMPPALHLSLRPSLRLTILPAPPARPGAALPAPAIPGASAATPTPATVTRLLREAPAHTHPARPTRNLRELRATILREVAVAGRPPGEAPRPAAAAWARALPMTLVRQVLPATAAAPPQPPAPCRDAPMDSAPRPLPRSAIPPWPAGELSLPPAQIERLTEEVMRGIDRRFVSLRERLGGD
jgi:hypothetical protein